MVTRLGYGLGIGECNMLCSTATEHSLVALFCLFVLIEDRLLLWMVVRSQIYYPKHKLTYGIGKAHYSLVIGFSSFQTD
jgi:hypothetical protein